MGKGKPKRRNPAKAASRQLGVRSEELGVDARFGSVDCNVGRLDYPGLINSAVFVLSKAVAVGRDHLIHRKRSPFPEKTEWRVKSGEWS